SRRPAPRPRKPPADPAREEYEDQADPKRQPDAQEEDVDRNRRPVLEDERERDDGEPDGEPVARCQSRGGLLVSACVHDGGLRRITRREPSVPRGRPERHRTLAVVAGG